MGTAESMRIRSDVRLRRNVNYHWTLQISVLESIKKENPIQITVQYLHLHVTYLTISPNCVHHLHLSKLDIARCNLAKRIKYFRIYDNEGDYRRQPVDGATLKF